MAIPLTTPFPLTGDSLLDAATHGYGWLLGADRTVRWSLSQAFTGEGWVNPAAASTLISQIFSTYSYYANIKFEYTGYYSSPIAAAPYSDINISGDSSNALFNSVNAWALGFFANTSYNSSLYPGAPGDIFINLRSSANYLSSYAPGSAGYFLFLHEIGHTLGLKHPHDDGGTGRPTLSSLGVPWLDKDWFTVMSYQDDVNLDLINWDPATPMLLDALAMQALYGINTQTNAGDNFYALTLNNMYQTLWDAGGRDRIDLSGSTTGWSVYLPDLQLISSVPTKAGVALPSAGTLGGQNTMYWLTGDIEDVFGSQYADTISGSALGNQIEGYGGNDIIFGGGGNDTFYNLSGRDVLNGGDGTDTLNLNIQTSQTFASKLRGNSFVVRDSANNFAVGRDIETIVTSNGSFATAAIPFYGNVDAPLIEIYVAAFRRAPEKEGYNYWAQMTAEKGLSTVADVIFSLDVVKAVYPIAITPSQFVTAIYANVFNKQPDAEGLNYWTQQLALKSRGQLVIDIANAALGTTDGTLGKDFFQNRVDWAAFSTGTLIVQQKESTPTYLTTLTNSVTDDPSTLVTLIGQVSAGQIFA